MAKITKKGKKFVVESVVGNFERSVQVILQQIEEDRAALARGEDAGVVILNILDRQQKIVAALSKGLTKHNRGVR